MVLKIRTEKHFKNLFNVAFVRTDKNNKIEIVKFKNGKIKRYDNGMTLTAVVCNKIYNERLEEMNNANSVSFKDNSEIVYLKDVKGNDWYIDVKEIFEIKYKENNTYVLVNGEKKIYTISTNGIK